MDKDLEAARGGAFPFVEEAVLVARSKLAPPSIEALSREYGNLTVGDSHPTGVGESNIDRRPTIKLDDPASPSEDTPPTIEEALAAKEALTAKKPKSFKAGKQYQVLLNKRIEIERDMWLSPSEVHLLSGEMAEKYKADIDAANEVSV